MMKTKLISSILGCKCPRCRKGRLFKTGPFNVRGFDKMNDRCSHCDQNLDPEPGFYMGAMYISYAFQVALVVSLIVGVSILNLELQMKWYFLILFVLLGTLFTIIFRLSRSIWIHICVKHEGEKQTVS